MLIKSAEFYRESRFRTEKLYHLTFWWIYYTKFCPIEHMNPKQPQNQNEKEAELTVYPCHHYHVKKRGNS